MNALVEQLKGEHQELIMLLSEMRENIFNPEKVIELLKNHKDLLIKHLKLEDEKMYPVLYEKAKDDMSLQITLKTFASDMEEITKFVIDFYNKYENVDSITNNKEAFIGDFAKFRVRLKERIVREEEVLFKKLLD